MRRTFCLFRHSDHGPNHLGTDLPLASELQVLTALYPTHCNGENIAKVVVSERFDVHLMGAAFLASVPVACRPDPGKLSVELWPLLTSRLSMMSPKFKKGLRAKAKAAGLDLDDYIFVEEAGLYKLMEAWGKEILSGLRNYDGPTDGIVVGFTHGGLIEPVIAMAHTMAINWREHQLGAGGLDPVPVKFNRRVYETCPLLRGKPAERCSGVQITVEDGEIVDVTLLPRPQQLS